MNEAIHTTKRIIFITIWTVGSWFASEFLLVIAIFLLYRPLDDNPPRLARWLTDHTDPIYGMAIPWFIGGIVLWLGIEGKLPGTRRKSEV